MIFIPQASLNMCVCSLKVLFVALFVVFFCLAFFLNESLWSCGSPFHTLGDVGEEFLYVSVSWGRGFGVLECAYRNQKGRFLGTL